MTSRTGLCAGTLGRRRLPFITGKVVCSRGFTLIELVVAIALVGIMIALALPTISAWRNSQNYRMRAKSIESVLREARSKAISSNQQFMVVFKPISSCYQIFKGDQSYNTSSSGFSAIPAGRIVVPTTLQLRTGTDGSSLANIYVQFYPNGTAAFLAPDKSVSDSNVWVRDNSGLKYKITVSSTGRVTLAKNY